MMENIHTMELSTQILIAEAQKRGIHVDILDAGDNFIRLHKGEKIEYVKQATKTSADSYVAALIMENKEVTKKILQENAIAIPPGIMVHTIDEALEHYRCFSGKATVVKPKSTNFGKGITILRENNSIEEYRRAVEYAARYDAAILIEEFIAGREYRFLVVGDRVAAVLHRVPANVRGDGRHTIEELVLKKNKDPLRGKGYKTPLEKIELGEVELEYLQQQGKDSSYIPAKDEVVYLRENSNISTGGDSIDFTDEVAVEYKLLAAKAAQAVGANICGVDMIIQDISVKPTVNNYSIIELNFNPALHIHNYPYQGKNREVEKKVLDLLGFS